MPFNDQKRQLKLIYMQADNLPEEFQRQLYELAGLFAVFLSEKDFQRQMGFTMKTWLQARDEVTRETFRINDHIKKVLWDTAAAKAAGGGMGITAGLMGLGGILAAPFTGGLSLALTVGAAGMGLTSAATSLTAQFIKDGHLRQSGQRLGHITNELNKLDEKVNDLLKKCEEQLKLIRQFIKKQQWILEILQQAKFWGSVGYSIVYKGVELIQKGEQAADFIKNVGLFVKTDYLALQGVNVVRTFSAGGVTIPYFKTVLVAAGSTAAKVMSSAFAVISIITGINDMFSGFHDMNNVSSSTEASQIYNSGIKMDKTTRVYEQFINGIRDAYGIQRLQRDRYYFIRNKKASLPMDVDSHTEEYAQLWNDFGVGQQFLISSGLNVTIRWRHTNKYLAPESGDMWAQIITTNQKTDLTLETPPNEDFFYRIVTPHNMFFDCKLGETHNGTRIIQYPADQLVENMLWYLQLV